jgi:hypothetical protein
VKIPAVVRIQWVVLLWGVLVGAVATAEPAWDRNLIVFDDYPGNEGPWRQDDRIRKFFHEDYPDDLQVRFPVARGKIPNEIMWVTVLDYDKESDTYLGKLLNQPNLLKGVSAQDNVVFKPVDAMGMPVAVDEDEKFWAVAVPVYARKGLAKKLYEGVVAYRRGNFGHNMPGIRDCISTLKGVVKKVSELSRDDAYLAHFVLGRCAAEAYETELAIQSFQAAVALRPDDLPGNMSLLAEYSVAVHSPDMKPKDRWEAAYLQQLEFIKSHDEIWSRVKDGLRVMFDEKTGATAKARTPEEVERGKQFGFGILRWKQR